MDRSEVSPLPAGYTTSIRSWRNTSNWTNQQATLQLPQTSWTRCRKLSKYNRDYWQILNSCVHCWKSVNIREKLQHSSDPTNIKYNCVVLLLRQINWLFIHASKYFFIDHHCKTQSEFLDLLVKGKIYKTSRRWWRSNVRGAAVTGSPTQPMVPNL